MFALSQQPPDNSTVHEFFFYNQLVGKHIVSQSKDADFLVDGRFTFEVGGKNKTIHQIKGKQNAWLVKDKIVQPTATAIPIWMFGFLYQIAWSIGIKKTRPLALGPTIKFMPT